MRSRYELEADEAVDEPVTLTERQLRSLKRGATAGIFATILALVAVGLAGWSLVTSLRPSGANSEVASATPQAAAPGSPGQVASTPPEVAPANAPTTTPAPAADPATTQAPAAAPATTPVVHAAQASKSASTRRARHSASAAAAIPKTEPTPAQTEAPTPAQIEAPAAAPAITPAAPTPAPATSETSKTGGQ